jgi:hypothetical protein
MTPDTIWQITAIASVCVSVPLGLLARRALQELDARKAHRR